MDQLTAHKLGTSGVYNKEFVLHALTGGGTVCCLCLYISKEGGCSLERKIPPRLVFSTHTDTSMHVICQCTVCSTVEPLYIGHSDYRTVPTT